MSGRSLMIHEKRPAKVVPDVFSSLRMQPLFWARWLFAFDSALQLKPPPPMEQRRGNVGRPPEITLCQRIVASSLTSLSKHRGLC